MRGFLKRFLLLGLAGAVFLGCVYGVAAYTYWNDPPKITRNYAAELNEPVLAVPENQRAWPIYRAALMEVVKGSPQHWRDHQSEAERIVHVKEVADHLDRQERILSRVRAAAKLPSLGNPLADEKPLEDLLLSGRAPSPSEESPSPRPVAKTPSWNPPLGDVQLTAVDNMSELITLLTAHAILCGRRHDTAQATEDIVAMIGMAEQCREIPLLVDDLFSFRYFGQALHVWGLLMHEGPDRFTADELLRLEQAARGFCDGTPDIRLAGERMNFADVLQRYFTDDGHGDGRPYGTEFVDIYDFKPVRDWETKLRLPISPSRRWSRKKNAEAAEKIFVIVERELKKPSWEVDWSEYLNELETLKHDGGYRVVLLMLPGFPNAHARREDVVQQRDAMLTASALVRYRLAQDKWPERLETLVPKYLTELPCDRFTGKTLGYVLNDDVPKLYSVGFDESDDGGVAAYVPSPDSWEKGSVAWHWSFNKVPWDTKGDLVLWPVQQKLPPLDPEPPVMRVDE